MPLICHYNTMIMMHHLNYGLGYSQWRSQSSEITWALGWVSLPHSRGVWGHDCDSISLWKAHQRLVTNLNQIKNLTNTPLMAHHINMCTHGNNTIAVHTKVALLLYVHKNTAL